MLHFKKFRKDIEKMGFEVIPYDPCVANQIGDKKYKLYGMLMI
jgi:hypothetical protein